MSTSDAPKPVTPFASGGIVDVPSRLVIGVRSDTPVQVHTFPNVTARPLYSIRVSNTFVKPDNGGDISGITVTIEEIAELTDRVTRAKAELERAQIAYAVALDDRQALMDKLAEEVAAALPSDAEHID